MPIKPKVLLKICVSLIFISAASAHLNNVCSKLHDYDFKSTSKNCWYNSDVYLSVPDIILKYGYPLEIYDVITQDGYILKLFRIPHGKYSIRSEKEILQPILLQHGIGASSAPFVINGNKSIGFILADEGYDVWMINSRGSTYGRGHTKFTTNDTRFWSFSFHDMAVYDTPKTLDLIHKVTKRKDIIMIGQSMGTNIQLAYAAELPEHAKNRLRFMVYLAPSIFLQYVKTPIAKILPLWPAFSKHLRKIGIGEILSQTQFPVELLLKMCTESSMQLLSCQLFLFLSFGIDFDNLPTEITPVILGHYPAGTSVKNLDHLVQNLFYNRFAKFDHGPISNLRNYRSIRSPEYQLSKVKIPGLIMYGLNDFIATKEGSLQLFNELPEINSIYEIKDKRYNHIDFFFAKNVVEEVIYPLLQIIKYYKETKLLF